MQTADLPFYHNPVMLAECLAVADIHTQLQTN